MSPDHPERQHEAELEIDRAGLARIRLRPRHGAALPFRLDLILQIEEIVQRLERTAGSGGIQGVLFETDAPHVPLPGYDLDEIRLLQNEEIVAWALEAQRVLRRIEMLPIPTVALIRDDWLGGAAELALACSHRVAANTAAARIGFPQTTLGFIPAWGGTVRLPRLIGMRHAFDLVLTGRALFSDEALDVGLVDAVLPPDVLDSADLDQLLPGSRGILRRSRRPVRTRLVDETAPGRRLAAARARKRFLRGLPERHALRVACDLIEEGIGSPLEQAFVREAVAAGQLIVGEETRGRLHSERLAERVAKRAPLSTSRLHNVGIVGQGPVALDMAMSFLATGATVYIKASDRLASRQLVESLRGRLLWEHENGRLSAAQASNQARRIRGATGFGGFGTLEAALLIPGEIPESVGDLQEIERHLRDDCLLLLHLGSGSPAEAAASLRRPERLIGINPAWPISHFPLLELLGTPVCAPGMMAEARKIAQLLDLTAIVVGDDPTPLQRLLRAFGQQALQCFTMGAAIDRIDAAARSFGFQLGPFERLDALGVPVASWLDLPAALTGAGSTAGGEGAEGEPNAFYRYRNGERGAPSADPPEGHASAVMGEEISRRLAMAVVLEAVRIVEDGSRSDPRDVDTIAILGLGFPRDLGGPIYWAEQLGWGSVVERLRAEPALSGFIPGLMLDLARGGGSILPQSSSGQALD